MLSFNEIYVDVSSSYFFAETYTLPTLWTNLYRVSQFAMSSIVVVDLVPEARPFFAAGYKKLHFILRDALSRSSLQPDAIRSMGIRDETNWRYQPLVLERIFEEFHEAVQRSRNILLNNLSAPVVRFSFFEPLRMLVMGFGRSIKSPEIEFRTFILAVYYLKYVQIPFGVPVSNNPHYCIITDASEYSEVGAVEERIQMLRTNVAAEDNNGMCIICQDYFEIGEDICFLPCEHCFHFNCVSPLLRRNGRCPIDRIKI